jgi:hypothetical protein
LGRERRLEPALVLHLLRQVARSLAEAHDIGIVHGDLKPDNIFICETHGEKRFIKVLDFGIARVIGDANPAGVGTPQYMAPEQLLGHPLLPASDVYAVGLVAYEMLLGVRLFGDFSSRVEILQAGIDMLPSLPEELEDLGWGGLIRRAVDPDPQLRYADGLALLEAMEAMTARNNDESGGPWRVPQSLHSAPSSSTELGPFGSRMKRQEVPATMRAAAALPPVELVGSGPLLGRSTIQRRLLHLADEVRQTGQGRIVILGGEGGVGKSVLGRAVTEEMKARGMAAGSGSFGAQPHDGLRGFGAALARALDCDHEEGQDQRSMTDMEEAVVQHLGRELDPSETVTLMAVCGWYEETNPDRLSERILKFTQSLASSQPLMLHLDDLDVVGPRTLKTLKALAHQLEQTPAPLFVLLTLCRDMLPEREELASAMLELSKHGLVHFETLEPLDSTEQVAFIRQALRAELDRHELRQEASAQLVGILAHRCHGNPRLIEEMARYLVQSDLLVMTGHGLALHPEVEQDRLIPPSVSAWLNARVLRRLDRHAALRPLLELLLLRAALLGLRFPEPLLLRILEEEAGSGHRCARQLLDQLPELLSLLGREDLLTPLEGAPPQWEFVQPLMQQFLEKRVDHLPNAAAVHRLAAVAKEAYWAEIDLYHRHSREIGEHLERAARPDPAYAPEGWDAHRACWRFPASQTEPG